MKIIENNFFDLKPKENAIPVLVWDDKKSKWITPEY